jgi:hypothetical protein
MLIQSAPPAHRLARRAKAPPRTSHLTPDHRDRDRLLRGQLDPPRLAPQQVGFPLLFGTRNYQTRRERAPARRRLPALGRTVGRDGRSVAWRWKAGPRCDCT